MPMVSHYCSGNLVSTELFSHEKGCGNTCNKKQKPCCKDEKTLKKLDVKYVDTHISVVVKYFKNFVLKSIYIFKIEARIKNLSYHALFQYIPPPDLVIYKIFIRLRNLRI